MDVLKRRGKILWAVIVIFAVLVIWLAFFQKSENPTPQQDQPAPKIENRHDTSNFKAPAAK